MWTRDFIWCHRSGSLRVQVLAYCHKTITEKKRQWNLYKNITIFIEQNALENGVCKMSTILFGLHCIPYDDVIKWKHFPRYWPFLRRNHRSPVNSPTKANDAELWFFYLRPNKRLSKQSWGWCFETPSHSLWRHCNGHLTTPHQRYGAPLGGIFAGN